MPIDVFFPNAKFAKTCATRATMVTRYGPARADKLGRRLGQLYASDTLEDLRHAPGHWHELRADRAGVVSADLDHPYRLLFRPNHEPPTIDHGRLDWSAVTSVVIIEIADTHE